MPLPIRRMPYSEAVADYGIDRPDLRFGMKLKDISDLAGQSTFKVFTSTVASGGVVKGLCAPAGDMISRADIEKSLTGLVMDYGAKGLSWGKVKMDGPTPTFIGGLGKFFTPRAAEAVGAALRRQGRRRDPARRRQGSRRPTRPWRRCAAGWAGT